MRIIRKSISAKIQDMVHTDQEERVGISVEHSQVISLMTHQHHRRFKYYILDNDTKDPYYMLIQIQSGPYTTIEDMSDPFHELYDTYMTGI